MCCQVDSSFLSAYSSVALRQRRLFAERDACLSVLDSPFQYLNFADLTRYRNDGGSDGCGCGFGKRAYRMELVDNTHSEISEHFEAVETTISTSNRELH